VMAGEKLKSFELKGTPKLDHVAVKEAVFPFARFPGVDSILGPEMKSTGEVMGIDSNFKGAFAKSQLGAGVQLPTEGTCFISVKDRDKNLAINVGRRLQNLGFNLVATGGTALALSEAGLEVCRINKVAEGRPHCVDSIINGDVNLVINTTEGPTAIADSFSIRRTTLTHTIPYYTTMAGAAAAVDAVETIKAGTLEIAPLQSYFTGSF
jgi:carbamoyl-phosphate synthase large subunit